MEVFRNFRETLNQWIESRRTSDQSTGLDNMGDEIRNQRWTWRLCWLAGELIISIATFAAFTVAFNTPTIGFGCRAFSYTMQWALSSISWVIIGSFAQPTEWQRCISLAFNTLSACFFIMLMLFQVKPFDVCLLSIANYSRPQASTTPASASRRSLVAGSSTALAIGVATCSLQTRPSMRARTTSINRGTRPLRLEWPVVWGARRGHSMCGSGVGRFGMSGGAMRSGMWRDRG
jgi:hypothetical protein